MAEYKKSCYDCVHCDVCGGIGFCSYHCPDVSRCEYFKDKTLFVELPCKIGETVYMIGHESIMVLTVSNISFVPYLLVECEDTECEEYEGTYQFEIEDFGKTVFLNFGEATKAAVEWSD